MKDGRACCVTAYLNGQHGGMAETNQAATTQAATTGQAVTDKAVTTDQAASKDGLELGLDADLVSDAESELGLRARCAAVLADVARAGADHAPDAAIGAGAAIVVTGIGWLVAAALTLAVWAMAAPANGSYAAPLHVAGQLWLAAPHVLLQTPDGPFGLSPLGFTVLPVASLVLAGRYAARHFNAGIWSFVAVAACYPLTALTIAWSAAAGALHADLGAAAGYPCLIASFGFGAGLLSVRTPHLDRWAAAAVRAGVVALAVLVVGAALLASLAVCLRFPDVVRVGDSIGQGGAGDFGLFLIDLALVPNLVVWALGFVAGPGFAIGEGSSVTVTGSVHGALPGLPLMQAVPHSGTHSPWFYLVFAIPLVAGAATVLIIGWSVRGLVDRVAALGTAVPAVGAVAGAGAVLSGGPVAAGAMSAVGPVPWQVALAVLGELAFVAVCGFGLWYAIDYGRGYIDRPRKPEPLLPEPLLPEPLLPESPRVGSGLTDGQHDDSAGLVGEGLALAVPERPEEAEQQGEVDRVGEVVPEGEPEADGPAALPLNDADAEDALPDAGAGDALPEQVQAPDEQRYQDADEEEGVVRAAADGESGGVDGDRGSGGVGEQDPDAVTGGGDERVEEGTAEPSAP